MPPCAAAPADPQLRHAQLRPAALWCNALRIAYLTEATVALLVGLVAGGAGAVRGAHAGWLARRRLCMCRMQLDQPPSCKLYGTPVFLPTLPRSLAVLLVVAGPPAAGSPG